MPQTIELHVKLDWEAYHWLKEQKRKERFSSLSHGLRIAVRALMEQEGDMKK